MKIQVNMHINHPIIPTRDYRRLFISIIKSALSDYEQGEILDRVYKDTLQKDFTWTVIFTKPIFNKDGINLGDNNIGLIISSSDRSNIGYHLFMAFQKIKHRSLPLPSDNSISVENVRLLKEKNISKNTCIFKTVIGSPFIVREHIKETNKDNYYTSENEAFDSKLTEALIRQAVSAGFNKEIAGLIEARAINCTKNVVLNYGIYLDANIGTIEIKGNCIILNYFLKAGISAHRSAGFGMLDLVEEK